MAVKGSAVIKKATALLGKTGTTVWNYYGLARGTAWCAAFVSYVMNKAGAKALFYGGKPVFYVPYAQQWLAKNCTHVKMADAKPGDIVSVYLNLDKLYLFDRETGENLFYLA